MDIRFFPLRLVSLFLCVIVSPVLAQTNSSAPVDKEVDKAAQTARAQTVLQQAREALGGEANLKAIQALTASGDFKATMGQRPVLGNIKLEFLFPDRYLKTTTVSPNPAFVMKSFDAVNGTDVWNDRKMESGPGAGGEPGGGMGGMGGGGDAGGGGMGGGRSGGMGGGMGGGGRGGMGGGGFGGGRPGGGQMPADNPQMQEFNQARTRSEYARLTLALLLMAPANLPLTFSYEKELDNPDGKADAIRVSSGEYFIGYLIFDQKTHRPLLFRYLEQRPQRPSNDVEEAAKQPPLMDIQLYFRDYKQVNNVWFPHQITKASNGQMLEEWKLKFKLNPGLKPKTFEKPVKKG